MSTYSDAVVALSPYLYWRLGSGGATDQSGNGRNGTANGGVTLGGAASLLTSDTADTATVFDGIDDYVRNGAVANLAQVTVAVWFQYASAPASSKFIAGFADGLGSATNDKWMYLSSVGKIGAHCFDGGNKDILSTNAISTGAPHMLAMTVDGSNLNLYIDGAAAASPVACGNTFTGYTVANIFCSGSIPSAGFGAFTGDEFAVWNSGLSAAQISNLYSVGIATAGLHAAVTQSFVHTAGRGQ